MRNVGFCEGFLVSKLVGRIEGSKVGFCEGDLVSSVG